MTTELTAEEREALANEVLGGAEPSSLMVRAVERIVAARVAAVEQRAERVTAAVEALADEWERLAAGDDEFGLPSALPVWNAADRLRAVLAAPNQYGQQYARVADKVEQAEHDAEVTRYVVGFAIDSHDRVALIRKARPEWQAGRLNGIGGHVEPGELPHDATRREFREETGTDIPGWDLVACMEFPGAVIDFYRARVGTAILDGLRTTTDEPVSLHSVNDAVILARSGLAIPNLGWLVPLAAYTADRYEPITVRAQMETALAPDADTTDGGDTR